ARTCVTFASAVALEAGLADRLGTAKRLVAVGNTRRVGKADLLFNASCPEIEIDPETYTVKADGEILACEPLAEVPLAQRYFLF
ncbi:MAG: urease subunit alpha, partial [Akkermansiaceae bacterium]|nr:urease subunit alpha [Akkermansiaceae bacterium]